MSLLAMDGIALRYPGPPPVDALRGVDLEIQAGELVAITGPSGSGKSSLLNVLGTLDRPTAGSYTFQDRELTRLRDAALTAWRAKHLGFVFQAFHLILDRTAVENVALALSVHDTPRGERRPRAVRVLEQVGMAHRADALCRELSGGEKQRVAIARAVVTDPALLLCDEPTGNLDSSSAQAVRDLLLSQQQAGRTIVVVTHDPVTAAWAHREIRLVDGLIAHGAPV